MSESQLVGPCPARAGSRWGSRDNAQESEHDEDRERRLARGDLTLKRRTQRKVAKAQRRSGRGSDNHGNTKERKHEKAGIPGIKRG